MYYKGYEIEKTFKHGYYYYRIHGEKSLYTTIKSAKQTIDSREQSKAQEDK